MPTNAFRFGTGGLPPFGRGGRGGRSGSISFQNSSGTKAKATACPPAGPPPLLYRHTRHRSSEVLKQLLKALKAKPLTYEEIRNVLALQSKSGAYSYVSMAIAQGHPIGKMQEGRSRKVIRTDVTYGSQAGS